MDTIEAIRTRRSIRKYTTDPVPDDMVETILDAGRWAPAARNVDDVAYVVVRDADKRARLAELCTYGPFLADAPVAIIVVGDTSKGRWATVDASAAIQNMLLATHALGLGSCWLGTMDNEAIANTFGIPDHCEVVTVLPIGYPDQEGKSDRPPLDTLVHDEQW